MKIPRFCSGFRRVFKHFQGKIALSTPLWETSLPMPPRQDASEVDARDVDTPDNWIKRHPDTWSCEAFCVMLFCFKKNVFWGYCPRKFRGFLKFFFVFQLIFGHFEPII